jgi:hypothetical protein
MLIIMPGASSSFQTDIEISGSNTRGERMLQRWVPEGPESNDFSLESGNTATWDQFETNSRIFGATSTYDENLYTTTINRNDPSFKRREAEAERIAREIEGATSTNAHVREERGQALEQDDGDEEEKYSGVRRDDKHYTPLSVGGTNKYTPPARRAPMPSSNVLGVPVDPAIISAHLTRPEHLDQASQPRVDAADNMSAKTVGNGKEVSSQLNGAIKESNAGIRKDTIPEEEIVNAVPVSKDHESADNFISEGPTDNVEAKVLHQFRQFADSEKQRVIERRRLQQNQDRAAKLNELLRFSKTFKLKTPIPNDLIGILAKDPVKQETIVEKALKESGESLSSKTSPVQPVDSASTSRKAEIPQPLPVQPDRQQGFNRGRGGYMPNGRADRLPGQQQPPMYPIRNNSGQYPNRYGGHQPDRKTIPPPALPPTIPNFGDRLPPTGPMADQSGLSSPQRSTMTTPSSALSGRPYLNSNATVFRPGAAAFNPGAPSLPPSSPISTQRASSVARNASPSLLFGKRKSRAEAPSASVTKGFDPPARMLAQYADFKPTEDSKSKSMQHELNLNGGIPRPFHTLPRWVVREDNSEKTWNEQAVILLSPPIMTPLQSRSTSNQHIPYAAHGMAIPSGPANIPHITTPQHISHPGGHQFAHQYDEGSHRVPFGANVQGMYSSPGMGSRQASAYASPMTNQAQLSYQQPQYFGTPSQMSVQMRPYPGTPGMMHAQVGQMPAPIMVQQPSNGPYMAVPQPFNHQAQMYSPSPGHAYPHQNGGYSSPGRMAPMMMQQGSQQGHGQAPNMMYSVSSQGTPVMYQQQPQMMSRASYGGNQYGTPHQGYAMQQRTMSSGYGQGQMAHKMHQMQQTPIPNMNGPPHGMVYGQMDGTPNDGK